MELTLNRFQFTETTTLGTLHVDDRLECYTVEDRVRVDPNPLTPQNEAKVYGATAIPEGTYDVDITFSPHFQKSMILLKNVPSFTGIRVHGGNDHLDTKGCILVGDKLSGWSIKGGTSTPAIRRLFALVDGALKAGAKVTITVTHGAELFA